MLAQENIHLTQIKENQVVSFKYKNYKGIVASRKVQPIEIRFGSTEWHQEKQWLLKAFDLDKNAIREFAIKDIENWQSCYLK